MINATNEPPAVNNLAELEQLAEIRNVVEYRLKNGLKVLLMENHTAPVVTFLVVYKVGSRNEGVGYTGSTHFLEHMLFKGTKKHNNAKGNGIDDLLTQIGAYWNATTWFDRTSYFEVVPSEYLEMCVDLEADRMRNLLLRQEDHDSEMSVVRNELERGENHPEDALEKEMYAVAFREHPYHHPTIGWRSDVEGVPMARLKEFYDTFYYPNNATVVLVGDFETDKALKIIQKHYGKIPASPQPIPAVYTIEPPQEGERRYQIKRAGDLPRVWAGYHVPNASHPDNYALAAVRHILGGTYERSSRLYQSMIDSGIASDAFARHHDLRDPGLFLVGAMLNEAVELEKAESVLYEELAKLASTPVAPQELLRAKSANFKGTILSKADPSSLAFMLGEAESKADWQWLMHYDERFEAVTAEDIMRVCKKYFVPQNRTVGIFIPEHQENVDFNAPADVSSLAHSQIGAPPPLLAESDVKVLPEAKPLTLKALLAENPPVAKVKVARPKAPMINYAEQVRKHVFSNGLTLLMMLNPGTESLGLAGVCKAGKYFSYDKNSNLADLAVDLLPKGSAHYSKMQIAEILEGMGVSSALDFSIDNYRLSFNTTLVAADLAEFSKLLSDVLRRPSFDAEELTKTKVEWKAKYAEAMNSTRMLAFNKFRGNIYPKDHPFYETVFDEQLAELDLVSLDAIKELHASLVKPNTITVAIVGDIDFEKTVAIFEEAFGDWQSGSTSQIIIPPVALPAKPNRLTINVPDKRSADVVLGHPCSLTRASAEFYHARIANAVLGQDTITSRLGQIVRDRAGLTYGIYSAFSDTAFGAAPWTVGLSVNPLNVDKALSLVSEVLKDFLDTGITEEELAKETGRAIGSFKVGLASSLGIARALTEFEFLGVGVAELDQITDRYASITKTQVDEAMRKYMHPDKALTVVSGTFR